MRPQERISPIIVIINQERKKHYKINRIAEINAHSLIITHNTNDLNSSNQNT